MNCKQGDLAVIIRSKAGNEGKIVKVGKFLGHVRGWKGDDRWEIDIKITSTQGEFHKHVQDKFLRPIRPQPDNAVDETLTWLPVPTKETT